MITHRPLAGLLVVALAASAQAQAPTAAPATGAVRVRVTDPAGAPVPEATVSLIRGVRDIVAQGTTDADGVRVLTAPIAGGEVQVVVRRIGFLRADQFLVRLAPDTLPVTVPLTPASQELATVRVTDRQLIRQRRLTVDADAIASAKRPVVDALDVLTQLRPDMIFGLGATGRMGCLPAQDLWVNGRRIRLSALAIDPTTVPEQRMRARAQRATRRLQMRGKNSLGLGLQTALLTIKSEHIAEMRATDCGESPAGAGTASALFITLKPGVDYREGLGTYVKGTEVGREKVLADRPAATVGPSAPAGAPAASADVTATGDIALPLQVAERLPMHRLRLVGVYDEESGTPVEGVDVVDVKTGARTTTTSTGTATLAHLPEGGGTVRLVRAGYRTLELPVTISPADTLPITLLLAKAK
jgi:hypothetical protein